MSFNIPSGMPDPALMVTALSKPSFAKPLAGTPDLKVQAAASQALTPGNVAKPVVLQDKPVQSNWAVGAFKNALIWSGTKIVKGYYGWNIQQSENFLGCLFGVGSPREALAPHVAPLANFLSTQYPEAYAKIAQGSADSPKVLMENTIIYIASKNAQKLYPAVTGKIIAGEELTASEIMTPEKLMARITEALFEQFKEDLIAIDAAVDAKVPLDKQLFAPLAEKVLDYLAIDQFLMRYLLYDVVVDGLMSLYTVNVLGTSNKSSAKKPVNTSSAPLQMTFFQSSIAFAARSLANSILQKERQNLFATTGSNDLNQWISTLVDPLVTQNHDKLNLPFSAAEMQIVVKAFLLKGLSNILKESLKVQAQGTAPISAEKAIQLIAMRLKDTFFHGFMEAAAIRATGVAISQVHYIPLATALLQLCFSHDPALLKFFLNRFPQLTARMAQLFMEFDEAFRKDDSEIYKQRVRQIFWDPASFLQAHPTFKRAPVVITKQLSELSGNETIVTQLYNLCQAVGNAAVAGAESALSAPGLYPKLGQLIEEVLEIPPAPEMQAFFKSLFPLFLQGDLSNLMVKDFVRRQITGTLFKMLVIVLEKGAEGHEGSDFNSSLFYAVQSILKVFETHGPALSKNLRKIGEMPEGDEQTVLICETYAPLAKELMALFFETTVEEKPQSLATALPLPAFLGVKVAAALTESVLPVMLYEMHRDSKAWVKVKKGHKEALYTFYHNHRMSEFAHGLSRFVGQFVPYYLRNKADEAAKVVTQSLKPMLLNVEVPFDPTPKKLRPVDKELQVFFKWLRTTIERLGQSENDKTISFLYEFIREYVEGFLLHGLHGFSKALEEMELAQHGKASHFYQGSLHVCAMNTLLKEAGNHFSTVNQVKEQLKETRGSRLPHSVMLHRFKQNNLLHPILQRKVKDAMAIYRTMGGKLLPLFNLSEKEGLPAPPVLKKVLWKVFEGGLWPVIVEALTDELKSPHATHRYLHSLLNEIKGSLNSMERPEKPFVVPNDPLQREIADNSGALVEELVGLQPSIARSIVRFRPLRKMAGETVGKSARAAMESRTLLELIDGLVRVGLPSLHKGTWISKHTRNIYEETGEIPHDDQSHSGDIFFPKKIMKGVVQRGWNFEFPHNFSEINAKAARQTSERQAIRRQVNTQLAGMIEQQSYISFKAAVSGLWKEFQEASASSTKNTFGNPGLRVREIFGKICKWIWNYFLKYIVNILFFPIKEAIYFLMHQYFVHQANLRVQDISSPIHDNFFLRTVERIIDILSERHKLTVKPV